MGLAISDFLFLFDEELDDAGPAEDVALVAGGGLNHEVVADGAHFEGFEGVLSNSGVVGAVLCFEFPAFHVGEDRTVGVVL